MYEAVKAVIKAGNYDLLSLTTKINVLWIQGDITAAQKEELLQLAQDGANAKNSVDIMAKLTEHDKAISDICKQMQELMGNNGETEEDASTELAAEEFVAGKWYYSGDTVSYAGKAYTCTAPEGVACVWSPADYPAYWEVSADG